MIQTDALGRGFRGKKNLLRTRLPETNPPGGEFPHPARSAVFVRTRRKFELWVWLLGLDSNQQPSG